MRFDMLCLEGAGDVSNLCATLSVFSLALTFDQDPRGY